MMIEEVGRSILGFSYVQRVAYSATSFSKYSRAASTSANICRISRIGRPNVKRIWLNGHVDSETPTFPKVLDRKQQIREAHPPTESSDVPSNEYNPKSSTEARLNCPSTRRSSNHLGDLQRSSPPLIPNILSLTLPPSPFVVSKLEHMDPS
jgi:hypothetical protein